MQVTEKHNQKVAQITFTSVYPHYLSKVEKKGRTAAELHQVISWLTGYNEIQIQGFIENKITFEAFFQNAKLNPNAVLIKGVICGYRIEDIDYTPTRQVRYLDKLVAELAKGWKMEKVLRIV